MTLMSNLKLENLFFVANKHKWELNVWQKLQLKLTHNQVRNQIQPPQLQHIRFKHIGSLSSVSVCLYVS